MRTLTISETSKLLAPHGLKIGEWNEVTEIATHKATSHQWVPPKDTRELLQFSRSLMTWLVPQAPCWILLQIDNSTSPLDNEVDVFETLVFSGEGKWDVGRQRSFLYDASNTLAEDMPLPEICMFMFFALVFEWHIHLVCVTPVDTRRLGLLDGVAYLFGPELKVPGSH